MEPAADSALEDLDDLEPEELHEDDLWRRCLCLLSFLSFLYFFLVFFSLLSEPEDEVDDDLRRVRLRFLRSTSRSLEDDWWLRFRPRPGEDDSRLRDLLDFRTGLRDLRARFGDLSRDRALEPS